VADAVAFADVAVLATPYTASADALKQTGNPTSGKVLWDCTNPLKPDFSGLLIGTTTSAGEEVAALAPWAKVVKAIPPFAEVLDSDSMAIDGSPPGVFVCGDDEAACKVVATLVEDIGAEPILTGPLLYSRFIEPANMLLVALAYRDGFGPRLGLSLRHS
jgi:predicted dinucleotide-binding enzyme